ncbi:hypothetical protein FRB95_005705 [Tulasnella sp. JGI-2019a]|nr:hypothetical protein FRB95_005705 [Tulasnella sp. JGI-2019a]
MSKSAQVFNNAQDFTYIGPYNTRIGQCGPPPDDPYGLAPTLVSQGSVLAKDEVECY